jgi:hypothetical protein
MADTNGHGSEEPRQEEPPVTIQLGLDLTMQAVTTAALLFNEHEESIQPPELRGIIANLMLGVSTLMGAVQMLHDGPIGLYIQVGDE